MGGKAAAPTLDADTVTNNLKNEVGPGNVVVGDQELAPLQDYSRQPKRSRSPPRQGKEQETPVGKSKEGNLDS